MIFKEKEIETARLILERKAIPSPSEMMERLEELGYYVGQNVDAVRQVTLFAYEHAMNARAVFVDGVDAEELVPPVRLLFCGPSGTGKTYLLSLIFEKILEFPYVVVDLSSYSDSGLMGNDVNEIVTRLYRSAQCNLGWAACGLILLDEIDKLGGPASKSIPVQEALLPLLDGRGLYEFPSDFSSARKSDTRPLQIPLACLSVAAAGTFSRAVAEQKASRRRMAGFASTNREIYDKPSLQETLHRHSGLIIELLGRFTSIVPLKPQGQDELLAILRDRVLPRYQRHYRARDVELLAPTDVLSRIAEEALELGTGVRGLDNVLRERLAEVGFACFGKPGPWRATLLLNEHKQVNVHLENLHSGEAEQSYSKPEPSAPIRRSTKAILSEVMDPESDIKGLIAQNSLREVAQTVMKHPMPDHPNTRFDEQGFKSLLSASVSFSLAEKIKMINAVGAMSQFQIDSITTSLRQEADRLRAIEEKKTRRAAASDDDTGDAAEGSGDAPPTSREFSPSLSDSGEAGGDDS